MESVGGLIRFGGTSLGASRCGPGGLMMVVDSLPDVNDKSVWTQTRRRGQTSSKLIFRFSLFLILLTHVG